MIINSIKGGGIITQRFGENVKTYKEMSNDWWKEGHPGIDFIPKIPTKNPECIAVYDCYISFSGKGTGANSGYGNMVIIHSLSPNSSGNFRRVLYGHLKKINCKVGQVLSLGDTVGILGSTGFSTGPHVHNELWFMNDKGGIVNENNGSHGRIDFEEFLLP